MIETAGYHYMAWAHESRLTACESRPLYSSYRCMILHPLRWEPRIHQNRVVKKRERLEYGRFKVRNTMLPRFDD